MKKKTKSFKPPVITEIVPIDELNQMGVVSSASTKDILGLNAHALIDYGTTLNSKITRDRCICRRSDIKALISHGNTFKNLYAKAALRCIGDVLNNGHPLSNWGYKKEILTPTDRMPSMLLGAPIVIDEENFICKLTLKFNPLENWIFPYAISIEDLNGNEIEKKAVNATSVRDNNSSDSLLGTSTFSQTVTSHDANPPSLAKLKQNNIKSKEKSGDSGSMPISSSPITELKTYKNMKQNVKRINESQLRAIIAESVNKVLKESFERNLTPKEIELLNQSPIHKYKISADDNNYIYIEVAGKDCGPLKSFMEDNGYSNVNDCTFISSDGTPTGTRLLTFIHWKGFNPSSM